MRPYQNQNSSSVPRGGDQSPILSSGWGPFDQIPASRTGGLEKQGRIGRVKERKERGKGREVNKVSCSLPVGALWPVVRDTLLRWDWHPDHSGYSGASLPANGPDPAAATGTLLSLVSSWRGQLARVPRLVRIKRLCSVVHPFVLQMFIECSVSPGTTLCSRKIQRNNLIPGGPKLLIYLEGNWEKRCYLNVSR